MNNHSLSLSTKIFKKKYFLLALTLSATKWNKKKLKSINSMVNANAEKWFNFTLKNLQETFYKSINTKR